MMSSDSDTDAEGDAQDKFPFYKRKVGQKKILVNIVASSMDNMSFHSESNAQKWNLLYK